MFSGFHALTKQQLMMLWGQFWKFKGKKKKKFSLKWTGTFKSTQRWIKSDGWMWINFSVLGGKMIVKLTEIHHRIIIIIKIRKKYNPEKRKKKDQIKTWIFPPHRLLFCKWYIQRNIVLTPCRERSVFPNEKLISSLWGGGGERKEEKKREKDASRRKRLGRLTKRVCCCKCVCPPFTEQNRAKLSVFGFFY